MRAEGYACLRYSMKILLINDYATPTAGAEIMLYLLRDGLRRRGHDVRVFASRAQLIPGPMFADYTCFGTNTRFQALSSVLNFSARQALGRALEEFGPDIVHVKMFLWQLSPLILDLLRRVPAIYHIVTYKPICPVGSKMLPGGEACRVSPGTVCLRNRCLTPQSWIAMMIQRRLWRRGQSVFDAIVTTSEVMRERLEAEGVGPCEVYPNGCQSRDARPPLSGAPLLAYAGRLSSEKGVDTLLHAFPPMLASVPEARLWIAGGGMENESLKALTRRLGIQDRVDFLGALPRQEMERRFDRAWVQVVPSKWDEPFGLVAIEAMMRGTAVIASNGGGLRDIVSDGESGLLFPPGDIGSLAEALIKLATNRDLCERMGSAGRRIALHRFSIDSHIDKIVMLYERVIRESRAA